VFSVLCVNKVFDSGTTLWQTGLVIAAAFLQLIALGLNPIGAFYTSFPEKTLISRCFA
jgi:hypothetical protein